MSIRIIPQDELGSSEKRTAEAIPPLLFPRLKNLYNRRAERLRELAANNPLGDYLRFAALIAHAQEVVLYDHPLQMDLTARIKEANDQGKPPLDIHVLPRDKHWHKLLHSLIAELKQILLDTYYGRDFVEGEAAAVKKEAAPAKAEKKAKKSA